MQDLFTRHSIHSGLARTKSIGLSIRTIFSSRRSSVSLLAVFLVLSLLLSPATGFAQADTSSLSGTITDPSGAVLPNAKVTAHNEATGQDRSVTTSASGSYTIPNLVTGNYTIRVEAQGFSSAVQQGTHIDPNIGSRYDVSLKAGETSTNITVQADTNTRQT